MPLCVRVRARECVCARLHNVPRSHGRRNTIWSTPITLTSPPFLPPRAAVMTVLRPSASRQRATHPCGYRLASRASTRPSSTFPCINVSTSIQCICPSGHRLPTHPSIYPPTHPSILSTVRPFDHQSILFMGLYIYRSIIHPSFNASIYHPAFYTSIHPGHHPAIRQCSHPSIHLSLLTSIHPCIHLSIHASTLFIHPSMYPASIHPCHLSICSFIHFPCIHPSDHHPRGASLPWLCVPC